jgi:hypothetical protein
VENAPSRVVAATIGADHVQLNDMTASAQQDLGKEERLVVFELEK